MAREGLGYATRLNRNALQIGQFQELPALMAKEVQMLFSVLWNPPALHLKHLLLENLTQRIRSTWLQNPFDPLSSDSRATEKQGPCSAARQSQYVAASAGWGASGQVSEIFTNETKKSPLPSSPCAVGQQSNKSPASHGPRPLDGLLSQGVEDELALKLLLAHPH